MSIKTGVPLKHILMIVLWTFILASLLGLLFKHWFPAAAVITVSYIFWLIIRFISAKVVGHHSTGGALVRGLLWFTGR